MFDEQKDLAFALEGVPLDESASRISQRRVAYGEGSVPIETALGEDFVDAFALCLVKGLFREETLRKYIFDGWYINAVISDGGAKSRQRTGRDCYHQIETLLSKNLELSCLAWIGWGFPVAQGLVGIVRSFRRNGDALLGFGVDDADGHAGGDKYFWLWSAVWFESEVQKVV